MITKQLSGAEVETLIALVERGPLSDGDVPSKQGRDYLIAKGLATCILVNGQDGYQAATYAGRDRYKELYPGPDGPADTVAQAKTNRQLKRTLTNASR